MAVEGVDIANCRKESWQPMCYRTGFGEGSNLSRLETRHDCRLAQVVTAATRLDLAAVPKPDQRRVRASDQGLFSERRQRPESSAAQTSRTEGI